MTVLKSMAINIMKVKNKSILQLIKELKRSHRQIEKLRKSEEILKNKVEYYKIMHAGLPVNYQSLDANANILDVNPAWLKTLGYSKKEVIGRNFSRFLSKDYKDIFRINFAKLKKKGVVPGIQYKMVRKNGKKIYIEFFSRIETGKKREFIRFHCIFRDITKKIKKEIIENEIKKAKETAETYLNITGVIFVAINTEGKVILINKKGCDVLGYKKEEIIGKNWFDNFLPVKIRKEVEAYSDKLFSGQVKPIEHYENPVLTKKGKERLIVWNTVVLKDEKRKITRHFSLGEDITDRRLLEEKLRKSEENLIVTLDSIGDGVIVADAQKRIILMNRAAQKITGWDFEDVKNLPLLKVYNVISNQMKIKGVKLIDDVLNNKRTFHLPGNTKLIAKNNTKLRISSNCAPILDKEKNIFGVVVTFRDITEEFALQKQLQQFRKMESIGQLAGGIAHDFNNLLGGIIGLTDLMEVEAHRNCPSGKYVAKIRQTAIRASMLTKQLLAFSRRGAIQSVEVNLHNIIDEVVDLLQGTIDKRIEIVRKYNAESPLTKGDPSQLQNAMLNISLNARDAMPDGGKLSFYTSIIELDKEYCECYSCDVEPGLYIQVEISDTGVGIDKQIVGHIFEPFFTTKEVGKGTGLGLAAVYGIVKEHKGVVSVYSEKNRGTVFKLYFKCMEEEFIKSKKELPAGVVRGSGKILLVDDEEVIWSTAKRVLTILGYDVMVATNGEDAIKIFRKHHKETDLVILDMVMPKMSGMDTFRELKKTNSKVRVLISTGFPLDREMRSLINKGVAGLIQKPFIMKDFSRKVSEVMKK